MHRFGCRLEKLLRDQRWNKCAQDHYTDEDCVLVLVNDLVLQTKQCRDRTECEARRHEQRGKRGFAFAHVMETRERPVPSAPAAAATSHSWCIVWPARVA
jgi:hypothetical protein